MIAHWLMLELFYENVLAVCGKHKCLHLKDCKLLLDCAAFCVRSTVVLFLFYRNDYNQLVAHEYLKFFSFSGDTLDVALRKFLMQFVLTGESQVRVLSHYPQLYKAMHHHSLDFPRQFWNVTRMINCQL